MKSSKGRIAIAAVTLCMGLAVANFPGETALGATPDHPADRARMVLSHPLPPLSGNHLQAILVEVRYGPGEASTPHSHPCAVVGYVVEGSIRTQVQGEPEAVYKAGESFYEAPNGIHLVSANASAVEPAKFVAYFVCDHETPLSMDAPQDGKGSSR